MRLVAPFGYYGWGNIGDEATLQGFARLVSRSGRPLQVWVGSRNPRHTRRIEPAFQYFRAGRRGWKRWWAEKLSSAVVIAGGTPIMDGLGKWPLSEVTPLVEDAHNSGRLVAFIGVGTERLMHEASRRAVSERLSPCVCRWTVRSPQDQVRLIDYGVPRERVTVAADMAWLLEPVSPDWGHRRLGDWGLAGQRRLLGVNLLAEKTVLQQEPKLFEKLAAFLDRLVAEDDVFVLFLSNEVRTDETFDMATARRVQGLMKHATRTFIATNEYLAPQQMQSLIANCHATVSMRYHFCLFSALQGVPFLALKRSDKVMDLCSDLEWPYGIKLSDIDTDYLIGTFRDVERQRSSAVGQLTLSVAALRERAVGNLATLNAVCDGAKVSSTDSNY